MHVAGRSAAGQGPNNTNFQKDIHMGHQTKTKTTRNTIAAAVAVAIGAVPVAHADIELGTGLSVAGFADMSVYNFNPDGDGDGEGGGNNITSAGIDQFEMDFMFAGANGISARVDIEYGENFEGSGDTTFVEQAYITKAFNEQFSMKVGRFLSYSGWEAEEPTGLFQYSGSGYAPYFYGYYQNGVSAFYDGGKVDFMASVVTSAFNPNDRDAEDLGYELGVAITPIEGLTAKAFYIKDEDSDSEIVNAWVSYSAKGFTLAGEYNTADYAGGADGDGFLVMGNYAAGKFGITLRYVDFEIKDGFGDPTLKTSSITLSPSYKASDNLLIVAEVRQDNVDVGGPDATSFALEALFTF